MLEVRGHTATVDAEGRREEVGVELVEPVAPGDLLLCHAGIALEKLEPAMRFVDEYRSGDARRRSSPARSPASSSRAAR